MVLVVIAGFGFTGLAANLRQHLCVGQVDALGHHQHPAGGLAQVRVIGQGLGNDLGQLRVVKAGQPVVADFAGQAVRLLPVVRNLRGWQRAGQYLGALRRGAQRATVQPEARQRQAEPARGPDGTAAASDLTCIHSADSRARC